MFQSPDEDSFAPKQGKEKPTRKGREKFQSPDEDSFAPKPVAKRPLGGGVNSSFSPLTRIRSPQRQNKMGGSPGRRGVSVP